VSEILIERQHTLGLPLARQLAQTWATKAAEKFGVQCHYETGAEQDVLRFEGSGLEGHLEVSATALKLQVQLGFLAAMFQDKIEATFNEQCDAMLNHTASQCA